MTEQTEQPDDTEVEQEVNDIVSPTSDDTEDADTFTREYVEGLRQESAKYRTRAQRTDELAHRLHTELVRATGRLADPSDLDYAEEHLTDADSLTAAIDELLTAKPHLKKPTAPNGDVGQGNRGTPEEPASLLGILKNFT